MHHAGIKLEYSLPPQYELCVNNFASRKIHNPRGMRGGGKTYQGHDQLNQTRFKGTNKLTKRNINMINLNPL